MQREIRSINASNSKQIQRMTQSTHSSVKIFVRSRNLPVIQLFHSISEMFIYFDQRIHYT